MKDYNFYINLSIGTGLTEQQTVISFQDYHEAKKNYKRLCNSEINFTYVALIDDDGIILMENDLRKDVTYPTLFELSKKLGVFSDDIVEFIFNKFEIVLSKEKRIAPQYVEIIEKEFKQ